MIRALITIESHIIMPSLESTCSLSARHRNEFASFSNLARGLCTATTPFYPSFVIFSIGGDDNGRRIECDNEAINWDDPLVGIYLEAGKKFLISDTWKWENSRDGKQRILRILRKLRKDLFPVQEKFDSTFCYVRC